MKKGIIDFTKIYNKSEVTFYRRKFDPDFLHQYQYTVNPNDLPPLVVLEICLYLEEEI